jgi:transposase
MMFHPTLEKLDPKRVFVLDETGTHQNMERSEARGPIGARVVCSKPKKKSELTTVIGVLATSGLAAFYSQQGGMKAWQFRVFIQFELCPKLRAGDVLVMDNLRAHKRKEIRVLIEATGAKLLFLPRYSPDLSPIELFWSRFKAALRKRKCRTLTALLVAIDDILEQLGAESAAPLFAHCGYQLN